LVNLGRDYKFNLCTELIEIYKSDISYIYIYI